MYLRRSLEGEGGGQHHQAAGRLAREAFRAAADPARFPEQLREGLRPWQARKVYQGGVGGYGEVPGVPVRVATGVYDPVLAATWQQLGSRARAMHRCQGTGQLVADLGPAEEVFSLLDAEPAVGGSESDALDGFDGWLAGLARFAPEVAPTLLALQAPAARARAVLDPASPEASVPALAELLAAVRDLARSLDGRIADRVGRADALEHRQQPQRLPAVDAAAGLQARQVEQVAHHALLAAEALLHDGERALLLRRDTVGLDERAEDLELHRVLRHRGLELVRDVPQQGVLHPVDHAQYQISSIARDLGMYGDFEHKLLHMFPASSSEENYSIDMIAALILFLVDETVDERDLFARVNASNAGYKQFDQNFLLFQKKQYEEAVKFLTLSLQAAPDNSVTMGTLAAVYDEMGEQSPHKFEGKSPNKHNRFYIEVEPLPYNIIKAIYDNELPENVNKYKKETAKILQDLGMDKEIAKGVFGLHGLNIITDTTKGIQHLFETRDLIMEAFDEVMKSGPTVSEPCQAILVKLVDAKLHEDAIHRGPAQVSLQGETLFMVQ